MKLQKNYIHNLIKLPLIAITLTIFSACANKKIDSVVTVWSSSRDFVPYAEFFNTIQDNVKVVVLYKENPGTLLPLIKNESQPDIIVGNSLRTESTLKYFKSLNYLFSSKEINKNAFYPQLLEACKKNGYIKCIPVSFNLPAIIFSQTNESLITDNYMLSLDQIRSLGQAYNEKNENGLYTKMGFAPEWDDQFLFLSTILKGAYFHEKKDVLNWNEEALSNSITYLRQWITETNTSSTDERDFAFKYLYTPKYQQIINGRCLFNYMQSNELFLLTPEQIDNIDFRWIHNDNKIPIANPMLTLGIYRRTKNKKGAETFIKWFFTEMAQKQMLEHIQSMHLNTTDFGIAGGFSSLKGVNEHIFPVYYNALLTNMPVDTYLYPLPAMPIQWELLKEKAVIPYISESVNTGIEDQQSIPSISKRISEWDKQNF
ncbi:MAG: ABC transporter substrate-binding protein [Treponema sp.]|nr:ABC transporter substrate-binding protein [Treponema sp.]